MFQFQSLKGSVPYNKSSFRLVKPDCLNVHRGCNKKLKHKGPLNDFFFKTKMTRWCNQKDLRKIPLQTWIVWIAIQGWHGHKWNEKSYLRSQIQDLAWMKGTLPRLREVLLLVKMTQYFITRMNEFTFHLFLIVTYHIRYLSSK